MNQRGIGLIILIIAIAIILLLAGGGLYFSNSTNKSQFETGNEAIQRAKEIQREIEIRNERLLEEQLRYE